MYNLLLTILLILSVFILYICALYQDTRRTQISGTAGDFRFWRKSRDTGAGIQQIHAEIRKCKEAAACFSNHYHYLHIGT